MRFRTFFVQIVKFEWDKNKKINNKKKKNPIGTRKTDHNFFHTINGKISSFLNFFLLFSTFLISCKRTWPLGKNKNIPFVIFFHDLMFFRMLNQKNNSKGMFRRSENPGIIFYYKKKIKRRLIRSCIFFSKNGKNCIKKLK